MKEIKDKIMTLKEELGHLMLLFEFGYYNKDEIITKILSLIAENELGDSAATGKHGELHDVALSHTHGETNEADVERPLPSITDAENLGFYCESNSQGINCHKQCHWCKQEDL